MLFANRSEIFKFPGLASLQLAFASSTQCAVLADNSQASLGQAEFDRGLTKVSLKPFQWSNLQVICDSGGITNLKKLALHISHVIVQMISRMLASLLCYCLCC